METRAESRGIAPVLRLVGRENFPHTPRARLRATDETRLASRLEPSDVRLAFASQVADALEGGRAAILRPERRRALVAAAVRRGLREFDANLVIAIVQDGARHGEEPGNPEIHSRLAIVPVQACAWGPEACIACALALGAAIFIALLVLLLGA